MKLQNSYIFLKNPFVKDDTIETKPDGTTLFKLRGNVYSYLSSAFKDMIITSDKENFLRRVCESKVEIDNTLFNVKFILNEVINVWYLDVEVEGKTKAKCVKCLEFVQDKILNSGVRSRYIDIISYDSISIYYCDKISPKLNELERNLRKLLFNVYIVNFGVDYFNTTINDDVQSNIKKRINSTSTNEKRNIIKNTYNLKNRDEVEAIDRLQTFFYSLEFSDIQNILFTPKWVEIDEQKKQKFLKENPDLTKLSDEELRIAFDVHTPKSDWDRFFNEKINLLNIRELITEIQSFRNTIAHYKFFYKSDFTKCKKCFDTFNIAVKNAIKLTEDKDFTEKNNEYFRESLKPVFEQIANTLKPFQEIRESITNAIAMVLKPINEIKKQLDFSEHIKELACLNENIAGNELNEEFQDDECLQQES